MHRLGNCIYEINKHIRTSDKLLADQTRLFALAKWKLTDLGSFELSLDWGSFHLRHVCGQPPLHQVIYSPAITTKCDRERHALMAQQFAEHGDSDVPKKEDSSADEDESVEGDDDGETVESEETDDDEGEEEEPKLKYARLTSYLAPVYRNGDATSAFLVAGDKMVGIDVV
jgi:hypothetical protein